MLNRKYILLNNFLLEQIAGNKEKQRYFYFLKLKKCGKSLHTHQV